MSGFKKKTSNLKNFLKNKLLRRLHYLYLFTSSPCMSLVQTALDIHIQKNGMHIQITVNRKVSRSLQEITQILIC